VIALTLSLLCFAGCGGSPAASPASIVFMGDSITANWSAPWAGPTFGSHPNWINQGRGLSTRGWVCSYGPW
jgi:hypothetical protein